MLGRALEREGLEIIDQRARVVLRVDAGAAAMHDLIAEGVGPDTPVGIVAERSLEMLVGLLGVLKAGGAYTDEQIVDLVQASCWGGLKSRGG